MKLLIKSAYNRPRDHKKLTFLDEDGNTAPTRTKQCFKEECDINNIIAKYDKTGLLVHVNKAVAAYGDFTGDRNEFQDAVDFVKQTQDNFMNIPSKIRGQFENDPGKFCEFAGNPDNIEEMIQMGLMKAPIIEKEIIQKVEIIETKSE